MKTSMRLLTVLLVAFSASLMSCQKLTKFQPTGIEGNPQSSEQGGIAHTVEFKSTALHGTRYLMGESSCFSCHDGEPTEVGAESRESAGGKKEKNKHKKACASCHENFPHGKAFKRKHGEAYFDDPQSCLKCHGAKQEGRGRAVACATCHEASHTPEFKTTRAHGARFIEERTAAADSISCWKCHSQKNANELSERQERSETGRGSKRSCATCHESYPHSKNFDDSSVHGKAFKANPADCAVCHGRSFEGAGNSVSCKDCHDFPHTGSWGLPAKHGQAFLKEHHGEGAMVACADCHQKDSKVACDTCHYWHLPAGLEPHVPNAQKFRNGCTNCHKGGKQLFPENFQNGCYECHLDTTEPKVPKDWESMAKEATRSPQSIFKAKSGKPASKSKKLLKK